MPVTVDVSDHAIKRYGERVRPGLAYADLEAEVLRVVRTFGVVCQEPPEWMEPDGRDVAWLVVEDGICFPLQPSRDSDELFVATTCMVRGGMPERLRRRRNHRRAIRASRRAMRRTGLPGRRPEAIA